MADFDHHLEDRSGADGEGNRGPMSGEGKSTEPHPVQQWKSRATCWLISGRGSGVKALLHLIC